MPGLGHCLQVICGSLGRNSHGMDKNEVAEFLPLCFVNIYGFVIQ